MKVKSLNFPLFEEVTGFDLSDDEAKTMLKSAEFRK